jgi:CubicO group peptidase (beta-lactamase class C family)
MRKAHRIGRLVSLVSAATLLGAAAPSPDPTLDDRLASYLAGGYDPLTVPVDWYDPVETVSGGNPATIRRVETNDGVEASALEAAAKWAEAQNSSALLVQQDGRLILERYWQGTGRDTRFNSQSMAKTVLALIVGQAIAAGHIRSVDDPVSRYIRQWQGDPRGAMTIRHMLTMSSGLAHIEGDHGYAVVPENPAVAQFFGNDFIGPALKLPLTETPGSRFDYNNNSVILLGHALEHATGQRYASLLSNGIWQPLGLRDAALYMDRKGGSPMFSGSLMARPIDWLAIGQLMLDQGRFGARQLVPADWIAAMTKPSPAYKGYGYLTWLGDQTVGGPPPPFPGTVPWQSEPFAAKDVIILHGHGSQRVWIVPSRRLVVVRTGRQWPLGWDESVIPNLIIRGMENRK